MYHSKNRYLKRRAGCQLDAVDVTMSQVLCTKHWIIKLVKLHWNLTLASYVIMGKLSTTAMHHTGMVSGLLPGFPGLLASKFAWH